MNIIVRAANRLTKSLGLRIVPLKYFTLVKEAFCREKKQINFIQVGANDGVRFDDLFEQITANKWSGLVIEPIPETFDRLCVNYRGQESVVPLNIAIHPNKKIESVYHVRPDAIQKYPDWAYGIGSMIRPHLIKHGVSNEDIAETQVKCTRLADLINEYKLFNLDLIQIDTEGFDVEVIKTLDFGVCKPRVIKFEWMNLTEQDKKDVRVLLSRNSYKLYVERDGTDCIACLQGAIKI